MGAFLERSREAWGEGRPFAICHDKVHPGNVVFARGGAREKAWLIDWATMRLGPPGADLVTAMEEFCEGEAQEGVLREAYFGRLPAKVREARLGAVRAAGGAAPGVLSFVPGLGEDAAGGDAQGRGAAARGAAGAGGDVGVG